MNKHIFIRIIVIVLCFTTFFACKNGGNKAGYIQTGDLLFVGLPLDYTIIDDSTHVEPISSTSGNKNEINYIHVAILEVDSSNQIWIIDATLKHGVDRYPLDTFLNDFTLKDGSLPVLEVKRLKNNKQADEFVENAKSFCGRAYDLKFLPDNDEKYCSELVRDAYIIKGKHLFSNYPMNFTSSNGTIPIYWQQLFELIQQPIPQGTLGTLPNTMVNEDIIESVDIDISKHL